MKHNEQQLTGNPKPSGNLSYYNTIEEKEKVCKEMVGYNTMKFKYEEEKGKK